MTPDERASAAVRLHLKGFLTAEELRTELRQIAEYYSSK
jgi:hypothetical protein